jgi:hypothetical protein
MLLSTDGTIGEKGEVEEVKRFVLIPVKIFLYALENEMYGILFWCAMMAGVIFAWQYAFCSRNTWIIGKRKLLERHVRHREKIEGLKEYLF